MQIEFIPPSLRALDDAPGDLLIVSAFADERPLEGVAGLVDWRLCGALSRFRMNGFSLGVPGERILYPASRRLSHPTVLFMGLGNRAEHRTDRAYAVARSAIDAAVGLGADRVTSGLFGLDGLPSPLERTALTLINILTGPAEIALVTLVADDRTSRMIRDGIALFGASA